MRSSVLATIIAAIAVILSFLFISNAYKYKYRVAETISVTGSAEKDFTSDQIVWRGNYDRKNFDLKAAYVSLKQDETTVRNYLKNKGVSDSEIVFSAINIDKQFSYRYDESGRQTGSEFTGYNLSQNVTIDSRNIDRVEKISREITELIQSGIELNSSAPSYYYTKLSELKIDLLAKAGADAKLRAETIAKNSGSGLGRIIKASMGVFQITGQNSDEDYSYGGVFNTTSKDKTASITLKADYMAD